MALTKEQEIYIKNYVNLMVDYRETYEELSDHLISALENSDFRDEGELREALTVVMDEDFGGAYEIVMQERERSKLLVSKLGKEHFKGFLVSLSRPWIWLVLVATFFASQRMAVSISSVQLYKSCLAIMILPTLVFGLYKFVTIKGKKSIKEKAVFNMAFLMLSMNQMVVLFFNEVLIDFSEGNKVFVLLLPVVLIYAYSISIISFMNKEIQVIKHLVKLA
ncbi:hypothetical protein [Olivibacter sitiensis]|uniref:hypothetical protein n=1 Tax=Olivibacter sitiensis TaxID=376470 RepID=UPI00041E53C6|nr:hypothetical protein [Olivibacter sitiensis]